MHTFLSTTLPVIFLECLPLNGPYVHTMYVAVSVDGNHQPLPIAIGLGISESLDSWTWFLMRLHECFRNAREVCFITKLSNHLDVALSHVFPHCYHGYCCKSVFKYFVDRMPIFQECPHIFWQTCKAYELRHFEPNFAILRDVLVQHGGQDIMTWFEGISQEKWARVMFPIFRYNILSIIMPDEIRWVSAAQQDLPIISLLRSFVDMLQRIYADRGALGG